MQLQPDKNLDRKRAQARASLIGEKKNTTTENKEKSNESEKIVEIEESKSKPKELKKTPQATPDKNKSKVDSEQFLKNIRPKDSKNEDIYTEKTKKIERIIPKKKIDSKQYDIQTIRTYRSDIMDTVKKKNESLSHIRIKEKTKRIKEFKKASNIVSIFKYLAIASILVVIVVGFLFTYKTNKIGVLLKMFNKTSVKLNKPVVSVATMSSLVNADVEKKINISVANVSISSIVQQEIKKNIGAGSVENIYLYKIYEKNKIQKEEITSTKDLISLWESKMPNTLLRALDNKFMLGIYSNKEGVSTPFLILTTTSYGQAFAGIMKWELSMNEDVHRLFGLNTTNLDNSFLDKVIDGKDTRVSIGSDGKIQLIYSFVNKKTIVITTNKKTFQDIVNRIKSK